jgi:hypothetical protein
MSLDSDYEEEYDKGDFPALAESPESMGEISETTSTSAGMVILGKIMVPQIRKYKVSPRNLNPQLRLTVSGRHHQRTTSAGYAPKDFTQRKPSIVILTMFILTQKDVFNLDVTRWSLESENS